MYGIGADGQPIRETAVLPPYAELHCVSNFSFLRGASHPEELIERAHALGYASLAITDECSVAGVVRAHLAAKEIGQPLIIGSEFTLLDGTKLVLLASDRDSYGDLSQLITRGRRSASKGSYALTRDDVASIASRCLALWTPGDVLAWHDDDASLLSTARWFADVFGDHVWIAVELFAQAGDTARLARLATLGTGAGLPLVASGDAHMHVRARRPLQDTLTAIRLGVPVAECGYSLHVNGERHLRSRGRLATIYPRELTDATIVVAERCTFSLDALRYEYPREIVPEGETPTSWLRKLTEQGLARRYAPSPQPSPPLRAERERIGERVEREQIGERRVAWSEALLHGDTTYRYPNVPPDVRELIEHELALLAELRYEPYFLTVQDIVAFARDQGILCQGRGSAANSAVCYALGITEVDPARMSMLFERFISKERNEPPDIDVDFEHQRREEVMQYVFRKYGRDRAALAATLISYRPKSAVRDVGKALGLDLAQVDRLAGAFAWWDGRVVQRDRIREAGFDPDSPTIRRLIKLSGDLMGFPRHLSQHVGGFVIARDLLERMVPVENAAMKDRTVIQWDKDDLDAMGLLKVDCLALGMLSAIRRALVMVSSPPGAASMHAPMRVQDIPPDDPAVYEMIQHADTIGVFQIESRAQQSMLPRLRPRDFYDLVIEVAIVRPGPIQGGMVHPYLRRRQGLEPVTYPSDAVKAVLERTLGVPIFQEQVMQLAIVAAGFSPGEADRLRRSMAAWRRRGGLEKFEQRLIDGMAERGYHESFARQIYQQILGFGEYGFPESHSASFALLVYVSCWLKRHHPAAFTGALLNSQPMGFYAPAQLVADARHHGVEVRPVDVTVSDWDCTLESSATRADAAAVADSTSSHSAPSTWGMHGPVLRLGLRMISGLTEKAAIRIVQQRTLRAFAGVVDLAHRASVDRRDLEALADAGALATLAGDRHHAIWDVAGVQRLPELIADAPIDEPPLTLPPPTEGEDIIADYRRLGLTLGRHPVALLRRKLATQRIASTADVRAAPHGRLVRCAGIVIGRQRPDTAAGVVFVTLEDEAGALNVIVWRDVGERQRRELLGSRLMAVHGTVEREGEVVHVVAGKLVDLTPMLGALQTRSRDFH